MTVTLTPPESPGDAAPTRTSSTARVGGGLLEPAMLLRSLPDAVRKLNPVTLARNPVMLYQSVFVPRPPKALPLLLPIEV